MEEYNEDQIEVSTEEIADFVYDRLKNLGIQMSYDDILVVLDLEMEYYESIGLLV